jgi:group I intron endonuclease
MGIIYVLTNKINGKQYVGQTIQTFKQRLSQHIYESKKDNPCMIIAKAIKKYGIENFDVKIHNIMKCCLCDTEKIMIKTLNTKVPNGYNIREGGEGAHNYICSEETKKKLSKLAKGKHISEWQKQRISEANSGAGNYWYGKSKSTPFYGKHHTKESKDNLAKIACIYEYEITTPNNEVVVINNMRKYCRENNLNQSSMRKVAMGTQDIHKGYTARKLNQIEKEN